MMSTLQLSQPIVVIGGYVLTDATEADPDGSGRRCVPLTPRHTGALATMWEQMA